MRFLDRRGGNGLPKLGDRVLVTGPTTYLVSSFLSHPRPVWDGVFRLFILLRVLGPVGSLVHVYVGVMTLGVCQKSFSLLVFRTEGMSTLGPLVLWPWTQTHVEPRTTTERNDGFNYRLWHNNLSPNISGDTLLKPRSLDIHHLLQHVVHHTRWCPIYGTQWSPVVKLSFKILLFR